MLRSEEPTVQGLGKKNGAISLKRIRTLARAVENLVVNSRIPPPFANRPFGEQCLRW